MHSHRLPVVIPLVRPWPLRLWDGLAAWAAARRQQREARLLCAVSESALEDMAAPAEWRAAAAQCRARDEMERSLLRVGIVPGARW